jgi:hypothetical protein
MVPPPGTNGKKNGTRLVTVIWTHASVTLLVGGQGAPVQSAVRPVRGWRREELVATWSAVALMAVVKAA